MLLKTGNGKDLQIPLLNAAGRKEIDLAALTEQANADGRVFTLRELLAFYLNALRRRRVACAAENGKRTDGALRNTRSRAVPAIGRVGNRTG